MEPVDILSCIGCGRIVDQWTMVPFCKRCGTNRFKLINPSAFTVLCWFLNEPKHVFKLILQDILEKYR